MTGDCETLCICDSSDQLRAAFKWIQPSVVSSLPSILSTSAVLTNSLRHHVGNKREYDDTAH